jgi:YVTN family beta-propeller protein
MINRLQQFIVAALLGAAALAHGTMVYASGSILVANRGSASISVIDVKTDTSTSIPLVGGTNTPEPLSLAYSAAFRRVFVGDRANNRVVVLSGNDFAQESTVSTGAGLFHMWASDTVDQLWVVNDIDKTVTVIDTVTLDVITTIPMPADLIGLGGRPHDVIVDPTSPFAYVTMISVAGAADFVVKYSSTTFLESGRVAVGKDPHVSLSRQSNLLYVPCQNSNSVYVIDRDTLTPETIIPASGAHGAAMARNGKRFYSTNLPGGGPGGLIEIDTKTNGVVATTNTPLPVPHNIALTPNSKKIYVTHSGASSDQVSVYEVKNKHAVPEFLGTVTTGMNPFGVVFTP